MAYHITLITNNSASSVAVTNPAYEADSVLIGPAGFKANNPYKPQRPILVNKITGNPSYDSTIATANNLYTVADNYSFWDNGNSAVNGIGQNGGGAINFLNTSAGNLQITVNKDGTLTFVKASASAAA